MRHRKAGVKLNRSSSHRRAMFRNMVTSLFKYDRIRTTDAKAKELRSWADHLVTLAKRGDLHARRQALSIMREKDVVHKLFEEAPKRFGAVAGGYTRIVKVGPRAGDATVKKKKAKKPKAAKAAKPAVAAAEAVEAPAADSDQAMVEAAAADQAPVEADGDAAPAGAAAETEAPATAAPPAAEAEPTAAAEADAETPPADAADQGPTDAAADAAGDEETPAKS
jgi:large subunit ribosomal protein L17